jgi:hypothetical protein
LEPRVRLQRKVNFVEGSVSAVLVGEVEELVTTGVIAVLRMFGVVLSGGKVREDTKEPPLPPPPPPPPELELTPQMVVEGVTVTVSVPDWLQPK